MLIMPKQRLEVPALIEEKLGISCLTNSLKAVAEPITGSKSPSFFLCLQTYLDIKLNHVCESVHFHPLFQWH